jgi:hypothetical protein
MSLNNPIKRHLKLGDKAPQILDLDTRWRKLSASYLGLFINRDIVSVDLS